ncbi:TPA: siroheme synthase, partial [Neisseria meningitidis]
MNYFPIFANLAGRPVLVVGGGAVAARKISLLLKAGAEVRVAAKHLNTELSALAAENKILWLAEEFRAEHIRTVFLIIAASSDQALNRRVFQLAESCQKPVNVVDDRDYCSFIFPSIINRNPIQIAVSSSGSAPVLARLLREKLEALLPPSLGDMAEISGRWRDAVKAKLKSVTERRRFWEKQFNGRFAALVKNQQTAQAEQELAKQLEQNYQGGFVSLVGAGPGDAGLLTLKGLQEIQQADVVLYDALVSDGILSLVRRDAERIFVGKRARGGRTPQEDT